VKDRSRPSLKRTVLNFNFSKLDPQPEAYKFLGMWYLKSEIQKKRIVGNVKGPVVVAENPEGHRTWGFLISPPADNPLASFLLHVSSENIPFEVETGEPTLSFMGGFDSPSVINNPDLDTQFLFLSYPTDDYDELRSRLGTIDLELPSS
jgi:hypothetical protein